MLLSFFFVLNSLFNEILYNTARLLLKVLFLGLRYRMRSLNRFQTGAQPEPINLGLCEIPSPVTQANRSSSSPHAEGPPRKKGLRSRQALVNKQGVMIWSDTVLVRPIANE